MMPQYDAPRVPDAVAKVQPPRDHPEWERRLLEQLDKVKGRGNDGSGAGIPARLATSDER